MNAPFLPIGVACTKYGIATLRDQAHFLGQLEIETANFTDYTESFNYTPEALMRLYGNRISDADALKFGRTAKHPANENAIANIIYGGEFGRTQLGNTKPGDGWKFGGKGGIQLTGRDNVTRYSMSVYGDIRVVENPHLLLLDPDRFGCAGWFWRNKGISEWANRNDYNAVSSLVNRGSVGKPAKHAAERMEATKRWEHYLHV